MPPELRNLKQIQQGAFVRRITREDIMGRGILLWLLGVPIPIIILLALIWH
jgi:hypothetical protein